jgi:serine/threonine protein kinase
LLKSIGKYKINGMIARGTKCKVYLAQDPNLSIQVAIKVFDCQIEVDKYSLNEARQEQQHKAKKTQIDFINESKILHQLSSAPHIVPFMEFDFTEAKQPFIVMPYYKRSLADLLGTENKLSTRQTLLITQQILSGLASIHAAGLVHLDIKPANILLDDNDQVLIADFGISIAKVASVLKKPEASALPDTDKTGIGSQYYASPEQLKDAQNATVQSDIYAVAALMYRCLSAQQFSTTQLPLNKLNPSIDEQVSSLVALGLSTSPEHRPESAKQMAESIANIIKRFEDEISGEGQNDDPEATRIWVNRAAVNNNMDALKESIQQTLLKEGEITPFHFSRLALLAKAELHETFSAQWLNQCIQQAQSQLARESANAAAFFLWVEQVNDAINTSSQKTASLKRAFLKRASHKPGIAKQTTGLSEQTKQHLIELGNTTLNIPTQEVASIIERKLLTNQGEGIDTSSSVAGYERKSRGRFLSAILIIALAFFIPWWLYSDRTPISRDDADLAAISNIDGESVANNSSSGGSRTQVRSDENFLNDISQIQIENSHSVDTSSGKIQIILQVQPSDAGVVLQSMQGISVSNKNVQQGEYWLRVSKNGYKTVSKKIMIDANPYIINEQLALSDTRYFIGNTDRTVADGIPVEFILLPRDAMQVSAEATKPLGSRIRMMSFEVTNQLYSACVNDGKCATSKKLSTDPRYRTFSLPEHPVVNVSWYDITEQFIPWLSAQIGSSLRLPTKHEWEFAAAGTADNNAKTYSWGPRVQMNSAHCRNCGSVNSGSINSGSVNNSRVNSTMPVRSFAANNWQLYDMHGNVQEWTISCPQPSSSLTLKSTLAPRCDLAIVKGGSWLSDKSELAISIDDYLKKTVRSHTTGFRLVEEVNE